MTTTETVTAYTLTITEHGWDENIVLKLATLDEAIAEAKDAAVYADFVSAVIRDSSGAVVYTNRRNG